MYFVIVIDHEQGGRAAYFDQDEPALLKNRRFQATEWTEYTEAQQACRALQSSLPRFQLASVRQDWLGVQLHSR